MSGFESDLLEGIADLIAQAGIATWSPNAVYAAGQTGIVIDKVAQSPDRLVILSDYPVSDDPTLSDSVVGVQVRTRWAGQDPRPVKDLSGSIFDLLHGMPARTLSTGVRVTWCRRNSGASLGQDDSDRWARSDNYYFGVHRPSSNRI